MDRDYFMNAGIPPPQFDTTSPFPWSGLSSTAEQPFMDPSSSMEQYSHFESPFSSMVSSPAAAASSAMSNDAFVLRELIGKLGTSPATAAFPAAASQFAGSNTTSSPLSPPKLNLPILDQINIPNLPPTPPLPSLSADPGFAERAAKFSCFGSRSFNGRTSPFGANNVEMGHRSGNPLKLSRVSSSPALKNGGSSPENNNSTHLARAQMENTPGNGNLMGSEKKMSRLSGSAANSNEESSVSEQIPSGETGSKTSNEMNSRKRKGVSRGKSKEDNNISISAKGIKCDDDGNAKRSKATEIRKNETKNDEEAANDESEKQKGNEKPPEAPKDYIHVRARRGQATDSHSLAERVRREKISERMKLLQDLVPGCNKVTGKALMLDEIINYVQSLQRQVEFLSMKLSSVNPGLDFNMENLLSKDMFQQNGTLPQQMYPLDSSAPAAFYHHQPQQNIQQNNNHNNNSTNISSQSSGDPHQLIHLPSLDGFSENLSQQFPSFSEDDLHSIVQMGFVQNSVSFPVSNQPSNMKVER